MNLFLFKHCALSAVSDVKELLNPLLLSVDRIRLAKQLMGQHAMGNLTLCETLEKDFILLIQNTDNKEFLSRVQSALTLLQQSL